MVLIFFLFSFISMNLVSCSPATASTNATKNPIAETTDPATINEATSTESGIVFNLSIANGAGVSGLVKKVAELFKKTKYSDGKDKYSISHITNADNYNYENTQIICKSEDLLILEAAEDIKIILKVGVITTSNEISKDTDIAIIIGKDYSLPADMATTTATATTSEKVETSIVETTEEQSKTKTVIELEGSSNKRSQLFYIDGGTQVLGYAMAGDFPFLTIYVVEEGVDLNKSGGFPEVMVTVNVKEAENTYMYKSPGYYYVEVNSANCRWKLKIIDD